MLNSNNNNNNDISVTFSTQCSISNNTTPTKLVITKQPIGKLRESTESPFKSMIQNSMKSSSSSVSTSPSLITSPTISEDNESSMSSSLESSSDESSSSDNDTKSTTNNNINSTEDGLIKSNSTQDFTPILTSQVAIETVKISNSIGLSNFLIKNLVGKGGFGKVFQVVHNDTQKIYALKVIKKNHIIARKSVVNTLAEKDILKKISHPFIVNLHYAFQNEKKLYLVMDFINGGQLFYHLQKEAIFSEDQVRFYMGELILALEHLHSNDIVHRDLKPENILLDNEGHCILTDFGLAKLEVKSSEDEKFSFCGTLEYMAPEMLTGKPCNKQVDWWSIGILMFDMLIGKPPFEHKNRMLMQEKILNEKPKFPNFISSPARSLINGLLHKDPKKRLGAKGAIEIKQHPFFKSVQWRKLEAKEIKPPFVPATKDLSDISNFDHTALKGHQRDSISSSPNLSTSQQAYFQGFSFIRSPLLNNHNHNNNPSTINL